MKGSPMRKSFVWVTVFSLKEKNLYCLWGDSHQNLSFVLLLASGKFGSIEHAFLYGNNLLSLVAATPLDR